MDSLLAQIVDVAGPAYDAAVGARVPGQVEVYCMYRGHYHAAWRPVPGSEHMVNAGGSTCEDAMRKLVFALSEATANIGRKRADAR